jgi:hypothetical protein
MFAFALAPVSLPPTRNSLRIAPVSSRQQLPYIPLARRCRTSLSNFRASIADWPPAAAVAPAEEGTDGLPGASFATPAPLTASELLQIVRGETSDARVNEVLRTLLGWRETEPGVWDDALVPEEWRGTDGGYPDGPPDFIGSKDDYSPATDRPVKKAVQKLTRSIPAEHKQILRTVLGPLGFDGWKIDQLTPNRTRRATAANWIIYYYKAHFPNFEWAL